MGYLSLALEWEMVATHKVPIFNIMLPEKKAVFGKMLLFGEPIDYKFKRACFAEGLAVSRR